MSPQHTPNFCGQCGATLGTTDTYCSHCGAPVGPSGTATRSGGQGEFRRRIEDLTVEGWELQQDYGDRAVLIDRGFGSIGIHVILLLFTGGIGNLLYAWYCYSAGADRIELRADGTRRRLDDNDDIDIDVTAAISVFASALLLFLGLGMLVSSSAVVTVLGLCSLLGAGLMLPPVRRRLGKRRSITTFGTTHETDERIVEQPRTPCSACASPVDTGVERTYGTRSYVAGIPISMHKHGTNVYCRSCATGDTSDDGTTRAERASQREFA